MSSTTDCSRRIATRMFFFRHVFKTLNGTHSEPRPERVVGHVLRVADPESADPGPIRPVPAARPLADSSGRAGA